MTEVHIIGEDVSKALRVPFSPEQIGKLPKLTCRDCSQSRTKNCDKHSKSKCAECGNYISSAHIHLDYVGHAAVTDRLLQADHAWTWEFVAQDETGSPILVTAPQMLMTEENVGLWIRLTVGGVTRLGFGGGKNIKEAIGDALRNAAMRFGVALDLWSKEDLHPTEEVATAKKPAAKKAGPASPPREQAVVSPSPSQEAGGGETFPIPEKAKAAAAKKPAQRPVAGNEPDIAEAATIKHLEAIADAVAALRGVETDKVVAAVEKDYGPIHLLTEVQAAEAQAKLLSWKKQLDKAAAA